MHQTSNLTPITKLKNFNLDQALYGTQDDRQTVIYKMYLSNPRFLEMNDYKDFNFIDKAQHISMALTLMGAMIPVWALSTRRKFKTSNTKIWIGLGTAYV
jgi:hypothetical protein